MSLLPRQLSGRRACRGNAERFPQLLTVTRDSCDFAADTGSSDVKQSLLHGIGGQNYLVNRFPLAVMGANRVSVIELVIIRRQCAAILKLKASPVNTAHRHQLAIRGAKTGISAIRREHEPVARSHVNRLPLIDGIVVRRNNANFTVTMPDGTAYVSLLTDTGHCMGSCAARIECTHKLKRPALRSIIRNERRIVNR